MANKICKDRYLIDVRPFMEFGLRAVQFERGVIGRKFRKEAVLADKRIEFSVSRGEVEDAEVYESILFDFFAKIVGIQIITKVELAFEFGI